MKEYFIYDTEDHSLLGSVFAEHQPVNATDLRPEKVLNGVAYRLSNAVFDPVKQAWSGDNASYQTQKQVALLTQMVIKQGQQIAALTKSLNK